MEERIARHADIDTRRAMGFLPRKLVVPELNIRPIQTMWCVSGRPITEIILNENASIAATERGTVNWRIGPPTKTISYMYYRDGTPGSIVELNYVTMTWNLPSVDDPD